MASNPSADDRLLVVLDKGGTWKDSAALVTHWAEMEVPPGHQSIPWQVEQQAEVLRREYLAWVHELGEHKIAGQSVRDHLRQGEGSSYWWQTLIAEKSPLKSPAIYTVLKLRALERLYQSRGCRGLVLCSADGDLRRVLSGWCRSMGHDFRWQRLSTAGGKGLRERLRRAPHPVRAAAYLAQFWWQRLRRVTTGGEFAAAGCQATVVTYFPNIDRDLAEQGVFSSRYWGDLHQVLEQGTWRINWVWVFAPSGGCSFREALELRQRFAEKSGGQTGYFFWEEFLSRKGLLKALRNYGRLCRLWLILRSIRRAFHFPGSRLDFWPFLGRDWGNSLSGWLAMENCLYQTALETLTARLPRQEWGLYPWENQAWERAFNVAWKGAGHGKLVGFLHVPLRFLDLRSFEDPRSYALGQEGPPLPDVLAVGGVKDQELLEQAKFPAARVAPVEALRYLDLSRKMAISPLASKAPVGEQTLLVVTGYQMDETEAQLRLLAQAAQHGGLQNFDKILVKPHPFCPVDRILHDLAPALAVEVVNEPLDRLWPQAAAVYAANSTSAAVEAASLGLPTLVHIPENSLNLSPLLGKVAIRHVGTVADLIQGLAAGESTPLTTGDFFTLDPGLPRWRRLLTKGENCREREFPGGLKSQPTEAAAAGPGSPGRRLSGPEPGSPGL